MCAYTRVFYTCRACDFITVDEEHCRSRCSSAVVVSPSGLAYCSLQVCTKLVPCYPKRHRGGGREILHCNVPRDFMIRPKAIRFSNFVCRKCAIKNLYFIYCTTKISTTIIISTYSYRFNSIFHCSITTISIISVINHNTIKININT